MAATDPSEASGSYRWDCEKDAYSAQLASAVGVDVERFAPVSASHAVIGTVTEEAAGLTGIRPGTPTVAGGGDFPVSMLGFGIVGEGIASDVTGTSTLLASHAKAPLIHPAVQNLRHVVDGWIPFTILDCGGISMKWCKDLVTSMRSTEASYDELIEMASGIPAGSEGLLFYPYMMGERRKENTTARGGWFGITLKHEAPHFVRSVMEGVALSMGKDIGEFKRLGHDVSKLMSVGGGNPIQTSLVQSAQQQQQASRARDAERVAQERAGRPREQKERRVDEVELAEAVRALPHNDSEQAEQEHHGQNPPDRREDDREDTPRIDLKA